MSTITQVQQDAIADYLATHYIPARIGTKYAANSIAAINLALTGELTDNIPECMSEVIGRWILGVQNAMPDALRNSKRWKSLLPLAAGTGRAREQERLELILEWMWSTVLPDVQPFADHYGFGGQWLIMCEHRTWTSAQASRVAAEVAEIARAARVAEAARAARATAEAIRFAEATAEVPRFGEAAAEVARVAEAAGIARAVRAIKAAEAVQAAWDLFDPCELLDRLITGDPHKPADHSE